MDLRDRGASHLLEAVDDGVEPALVRDAGRSVEALELRDVGAGREAAPAPRSTNTRTFGSESTRSQASTSASYMSQVSALRA